MFIVSDMDSFSSLFDALGGTLEVARRLKVTPDAVRKMAQRQSIPTKHWAPLIELASDKHVPGVTLDKFARIATEKAA